MIKDIFLGILFIMIGAFSAKLYLQYQEQSFMCSKHEITMAQCPWCNKSLVKEMGTCKEHKVPEAFCTRCNKSLIAGFKKENDWCAGHNVPESQCDLCSHPY